MNSSQAQQPTQNQIEHVKKIDISELMKLAEKAGVVIKESEKRERTNELRDSGK